MANYNELFEDISEKLTKFKDKIDNLREIKISYLANDTLKEIGLVQKASDLWRHISGFDAVIQLNQRVFEQLNDDQQLLVIEELMARLFFDTEKGKLIIIKPDVSAGFSLVMKKHGLESYLETKLLIKEIMNQNADADSDNEEA